MIRREGILDAMLSHQHKADRVAEGRGLVEPVEQQLQCSLMKGLFDPDDLDIRSVRC